MGQPIVVVEKPSVANPGMVRFETNRALTGMGHERYVPGEVRGDRPPDELARRLLARGGIEAIHMNGSVVTVDVAKGHDTAGIREIIESLYIHYPPTLDAADAAPAPEHEPADDAADPAATTDVGASPEPS